MSSWYHQNSSVSTCLHTREKNKVKTASVTMSEIEWETTIRRIVTAWTWNPRILKAVRVLIFQKQSSAHTEFSIRGDIFKFHETEERGGWHCVSVGRGAGVGGCRLGYGDMVWRVRVNRRKGVMLHNLPNSPECEFASKRNSSFLLLGNFCPVMY